MDHCLLNPLFHFVFIQFAFLEIFFHQALIIAGHSFYQFFVQIFGFLFFIIRYWQFFRFAPIVLEFVQGHAQHVNDLMKARTLLPWILDHDNLVAKM